MQLYRYNNRKWFGVAVGILVVVSLLYAFALIFNWLPRGGSLAIIWELLRFTFGGLLILSWVILNTAAPRPPGFVIAFAELGEEREPEGASFGAIKTARRPLPIPIIGSRVVQPDYEEDEPASVGTSRFLTQLRKTHGAAAIANLPAGRGFMGLLPSAQKSPAALTALALAERSGKMAADGSAETGVASPRNLRRRTDDTVINDFGEEEKRPPIKKAVPPDTFFAWEAAIGARSLTEYLQMDINLELQDGGLKDTVTIYPLVFSKTRELALRESEVPQADMVIWGWNVYRKRRDYIPVFELKEPLENTRPARDGMQILGLKSFDLGVQTARHSSIFSAFVAGLGAYGYAGEVPKSEGPKAEQLYYQKAKSEFNLALTCTYMYGERMSKRNNIDRAIIYFFLGNTLYYLGELDAAANSYREAVAIDPEMIEARHNMGVMLFLQNKLDFARKTLIKVIQLRPNLAIARLNVAVVFLAKKEFTAARRELQNVLKLDPENAAAYRIMGVSFREEGEYQKAVQCFKQAIEASPQDKYAEAHLDLGLVYFEVARGEDIEEEQAYKLYDQATAEFQQAIAENPNLAEAHYQLAKMLHYGGQEDEAGVSLLEAVAIRPNFSEAHELLADIYEKRGRIDLRDHHLEQMMRARAASSATTPDEYIKRGIGARLNKDYVLAREEFEKALSLDPRNAKALYELGIVYQEVNEADRALNAFQTVLKLPAPPDEAYNRVSGILFTRGNQQEAVDFLRQAVSQNPNNARMHYFLGNVYRKQKTEGKAIESYIKSIQLEPDMAEPHFNLGMIYLNRKQINDAILQFREVVRIRPEDYETHFYLGRAYMRNNQTDPAVRSLEEAVSYKADFLEARLLLAEIFLRQAEPDQAIEQLQVVLTHNPNELRARELMGKAYAQAGKLDKAIETFEDIIRLDNNNASAHYNLGVSYVSEGRFIEAVTEFDKVIQIKPDDPDAYVNMGVAIHEILSGPLQTKLQAQQVDDFFNKEIEVFQQAIRLRPSNPAPYLYLGQMYSRINNIEMAMKYLNEHQRLKKQM